MFKFTITSDPSGQQWVHFQFFNWKLYSIRAGWRFFPNEFSPNPHLFSHPLPHKEPTPSDSTEIASMLDHPGYRTLRKWWYWQARLLSHACCHATAPDIERLSGRYEGFSLAVNYPEMLANFTSKDEESVPEEVAEFYENMRKMDKEVTY